MTSKEALERYYSNLIYGNGGFQTYQEELEGLKVIKQSLERLEMLEQSNNILEKLSGNQHETIKNLTEENEKLKKAIEILKDHIEIYSQGEFMSGELYGISCVDSLDQQEYELLKEVLGDA